MYSKLTDANFSDHPMYTTGKYGICPLNDSGIEHYLGYNSYNYHFLKKIDPDIIKEYMEEVKEGKKIAEQEKNKQAKGDNKEVQEEKKVTINETEQKKELVQPKEIKKPMNNQSMKQNNKQVGHNGNKKPKQRAPFGKKEIKFNNKKNPNEYYQMGNRATKQFPLIATVSGTRAVY